MEGLQNERRINYTDDSRTGYRVGITSGFGKSDGVERQRGTDQEGSERRDIVRTNAYNGDTPLGKILERLKLIEKAHFSYIHAHRQRLETRLEENKQSEQEFRQQIAELEQEIFNFLSESKTTE